MLRVLQRQTLDLQWELQGLKLQRMLPILYYWMIISIAFRRQSFGADTLSIVSLISLSVLASRFEVIEQILINNECIIVVFYYFIGN